MDDINSIISSEKNEIEEEIGKVRERSGRIVTKRQTDIDDREGGLGIISASG